MVKSSTPIEGQQTSAWCWVTAARMLVNHYYSVPAERDQTYAATAVISSYLEEGSSIEDVDIAQMGGTFEQIIKAASCFRSGNLTANELNLICREREIFDEYTLKQVLNDGHVIIISRAYHTMTDLWVDGHVSVAVGYETTFVEGVLTYKFIIYDPMPEPTPASGEWIPGNETQGQPLTVSYQWLRNGMDVVDDEPYDLNGWWAFIMVGTDCSYDTIDPAVD